MTEPENTTDPIEPNLDPDPTFGYLPSTNQDAEFENPHAEMGSPANTAFGDYTREVDPVQVGEDIPWDEHTDTRTAPIVQEQTGTIDDEGPPLP
jgi:hypothetical protein|tara:strand:- start:677 stop:958 length:282 start_codon:yes stop_codon:yes gene_type:complete